MSNKGEYLDHEIMHVIACYLKHDIVIIPVHSTTAANGMYTYIHGGSVWTGTHSKNCPIFLGNYYKPNLKSNHT